jgi:hypothetical protein
MPSATTLSAAVTAATMKPAEAFAGFASSTRRSPALIVDAATVTKAPTAAAAAAAAGLVGV